MPCPVWSLVNRVPASVALIVQPAAPYVLYSMVTVGMAPRLPSTHCTDPPEVMLTPLACSPSCRGELVNGASQPTVSLLIWQRVTPDLVSMKTYPFWSGDSGMEPAGVGGPDGAVGGAEV